jgi:hypothetical protein
MIAFQPSRCQLVRIVSVLCIAAVAGSLTGCGRSTATVEGRVTRNGRPVRGAVWFINEQNNRKLDAPIEPDGSYRLEGAPAGEVKVTVVPPFMDSPPPPAGQAKQPPRPAAPLTEADKIMLDPNASQQQSLRDTVLPPDRYANLKTSGLSTTLKSGTVNQFDIQLDDE